MKINENYLNIKLISINNKIKIINSFASSDAILSPTKKMSVTLIKL